MGIDIWEVVDAASTKPYGFMRFEPGPGMGGHCLPVDPFYLTWRAREFHMSTEFIELAGKINQQMPYYCVERIEQALNDVRQAGAGVAKIGILGVSYKGGTGDIRESPALRIIDVLAKRGSELSYHDPYVPELRSQKLRSVELEELNDCEALVPDAVDRAHVDDRTAAGEQMVLKGVDAEEGAVEVKRHVAAPTRIVGLLHGRREGAACVVHQRPNVAKRLRGPCRLIHGRLVGNIDPQCRRGTAARAHRRGPRLGA